MSNIPIGRRAGGDGLGCLWTGKCAQTKDGVHCLECGDDMRDASDYWDAKLHVWRPIKDFNVNT